ncbi:restriction endonuclease subunit S [Vibrio diabolicus]|uniref:restriction endonuclease subunit S n=1 Tax=Vibrio diabolicus TaxID=50719 RepID=UPI0024949663|nr:restriction endonuclease subunit S [Vibrio diabolicus]
MKSNWVTYTISDVAQRVITGKTPPGTRDEYFGGETLFVTPTDMEDDKHITETIRTLSISGEEKLKKQMFTKGVVVSCIGWQMGKSAIVTQTAVTNQQVNTVVPDENIIDLDFLYYVLKSKREEIFNLGATATRTPILKKSLFEKISFNAPCLIEQKKISRLLSKLDDKIRLNTQTNQTLEEAAQAIFKSWFVDFDPVKAKVNGEQPEGMDAATASLFPEKLVESELGLIPEGWRVKKIGDVVERYSVGKKYSQKTAVESGLVPILDQGKSGIIGYHNDKPGVKASLDNPIIVFANHTCYMKLVTYDFSAIQNVLPFKLNGCDIYWSYLATQGKQRFVEYKGHWPDFMIHEIVVPSEELMKRFGELVKPFYSQVASNENQNKSLAKLRDTILPKLLSGEIELGETEAMAEVN